MLLAADIGNTNIVLGIFDGETLRASWRLYSDVHKMPDEYAVMLFDLLKTQGLSSSIVSDAILCSVVPPLISTFEEMCQRYLKVSPLVVGTGIKTGVRILYDNPREVGADRVVDALAAYKLYGGPVIVVDFGTATVFDAVSKEGDYLGGAIFPGLGIATDALFERTARLPRIELTRPKAAIGKNTVASMQSGLIFGYVAMVEGLVQRFRQEIGGMVRVVATGGLAQIIAKETTAFDVVNPDLTLVGLRLIHELNIPASPG
ncbi:MAG: type III pantothenate kinase [Chloroflexi bacterium]|nr:type III pantothenate kinase [Chloroflexota bacterium]